MLLTDIYAAGEDPIPGITLDALAAAVRRSVWPASRVVPRLEDLPRGGRAGTRAIAGDVVITLGAGSIGSVAERLIEELA